MTKGHLPLILFTILALSPSGFASADQGTFTLRNSPWRVFLEDEAAGTGEQFSAPGYSDGHWIAARVPGTGFVDYVVAGKEPDPNMGDNVWKVNKKKYDQNYWYRTEFTVPPAYFDGGRIWLNLDSVHRDADVFVNGTKVGSMLGFFQRGRFDVTHLVKKDGPNALAVLAKIMYVASAKDAEGKWNFNASSPSLLCSRGWDWMPRVPGLNTGILRDVYLTHTGEVSLLDPWIRTALPKPSEATLSVQVEVSNAAAAPVTGELSGVIQPGGISFTKSVPLKPGEKQTVTFSAADTPALRIANPRLWWPNGYGEPNLYTCELTFRVANQISDQKNVTFGIKEYGYQIQNGVLVFTINGKRLFLKGGNWGLPEYLMRNRTAADYDHRVRLQREQNFNIIRNWMGSVPDAEFYEACDKYGIMVWDEFWLNRPDGNPADIGTYHANAIEKVKQFRNHPSIAFWCAMNEGTPPPEVTDPLREIIKTYDGDDRRFQPCSNSDNLSGSGPWTNFAPPVYFRGTFSFTGAEKKPIAEPYGLRSELGTAAFTNLDSFKKFIPEEDSWPRNEIWNRHFFGPRARNAFPDGYLRQLGMRYGEPTNIADLCLKAQLVNLETMKAMFEGWLDRSDTTASGLIIWMSHPAYPCFVWQTYDYYYDTTGAYWGAKSACEPIHIFWNSDSEQIRVSNTSGEPALNLKADLWIYNLDGAEKLHQQAKLDVKPFEVVTCFNLNSVEGVSATHFLRLRLTDSAGKIVSENFYWKGVDPLNYFGLSEMKPVELTVSTPVPQVLPDGMTRLTTDITNPAGSGTVAFAIRPKPVRPGTGEQVLPVFMSDGYFSLIPGETKRITIDYFPASCGGETPKLEVECWNNFSHPKPKEPAQLLTKEEKAASATTP